MDLEFRSSGTVAKFIIKSSLLILSFSKILQPGIAVETCTTAHLKEVSRAMINAVTIGYPKNVLEVSDIRKLAKD